MNKKKYIRIFLKRYFFFVFLSCFILLQNNSQQFNYEDTIPFELPKVNVTPKGIPEIKIPISLPVGTKNLIPKLELHYSTDLGYSSMGLGWELSRFEKIIRIQNSNGFYTYQSSETGELIEVNKNGNYRVFRSKIEALREYIFYEDCVKIFCDWESIDSSGNIQKFENVSSNGQIDSTGNIEWNLISFKDYFGNGYTVSYESFDRNVFVKKIMYNNRNIEFNYSNQGNKYLLKNVQIFIEATKIREFLFSYQKSNFNSFFLLNKISNKGFGGHGNYEDLNLVYHDIPNFKIIKSTDNSKFDWEVDSFNKLNINSSNEYFADFNGDRILDKIKIFEDKISLTYSGSAYNDSINWFGMGIDFKNEKLISSELLNNVYKTILIDINSDGRMDYIQPTEDQIRIYISKEGFSFHNPLIIPMDDIQNKFYNFVDIDGDKSLELVFLGKLSDKLNDKKNYLEFVKFNFQKYNFVFSQVEFISVDQNSKNQFIDMNNDGFLDFISLFENKIDSYINLGNGNFVCYSGLLESNFPPSLIYHIEDLNRDGFKDVVYTQSDGVVKIQFSNGKTFLDDIYRFQTEHSVQNIDLKDFNQDGIYEIILLEKNENGLQKNVYSFEMENPSKNVKTLNYLTKILGSNGQYIELSYTDQNSYLDFNHFNYLETKMVLQQSFTNLEGGFTEKIEYEYSFPQLELTSKQVDEQIEITESIYSRGEFNKKLKYKYDSKTLFLISQTEWNRDLTVKNLIKNILYGKQQTKYGTKLYSKTYFENFEFKNNQIQRILINQFQFNDEGKLIKDIQIVQNSKGNLVQKTSHLYTYENYVEEWKKYSHLKSQITFINNQKTSEEIYSYFSNYLIEKQYLVNDKPYEWERIQFLDYDVFGNSTKIINPLGSITMFRFDPIVHNFILEEKNELGQKIKREYDLNFGFVLSETDIKGRKISYRYDGFGRLVCFYDGIQTDWSLRIEYFQTKNPFYSYRKFLEKLDGGSVLVKKELLDANNQVYQIESQIDNDILKIGFWYDSFGNLTKQTQLQNKGAIPEYTIYSYYGDNSLSSITYPNTLKEEIEYKYEENLSEMKRILKKNHQVLKSKKITKNHLGQLTKVELDNGYYTKYEYNQKGEIIGISAYPNEESIRINRNYNGSIQERTDQNIGRIQYEYNKNNQLICKKTGDVEKYYEYDSLGRITKISTNIDDHPIYFYYDESENGYFNVGELTSVIYGDQAEYYSYNLAGEMTKKTVRVDDFEFTIKKKYNQFRQLVETKYPNENLIVQNIENNGFEKIIQYQFQSHGSKNLVEYYSNPLENRLSKIYDNGLRVDKKMDSFDGKVSEEMIFNDENNHLLTYQYQYSSLGILEKIISSDQNVVKYKYDSLGRVTSSIMNHTQINYQFSKNGNIQKKGNTIMEYDSLSHPNAITGSIPPQGYKKEYIYDKTGKMVVRDFDEIKYDGYGNLVQYKSLKNEIDYNYLYNYKNQRIKEEINHQKTYFIDDNYQLTIADDGSIEEVIFIYGAENELIALVRNQLDQYNNKLTENRFSVLLKKIYSFFQSSRPVDSAITYFDTDIRTSVRHQVDTGKTESVSNLVSNETLPDFQIYPFGEIEEKFNSFEEERNLIAYLGKKMDPTGLYYFQNRYYDPEIGQFIQPDPNIYPEDINGLNQYMYVNGNPIMYKDLDGKRGCPFSGNRNMLVFGEYQGDGRCDTALQNHVLDHDQRFWWIFLNFGAVAAYYYLESITKPPSSEMDALAEKHDEGFESFFSPSYKKTIGNDTRYIEGVVTNLISPRYYDKSFERERDALGNKYGDFTPVAAVFNSAMTIAFDVGFIAPMGLTIYTSHVLIETPRYYAYEANLFFLMNGISIDDFVERNTKIDFNEFIGIKNPIHL